MSSANVRPNAPSPIGILINIDVDDLERAKRFYTEAFGLRVGRPFRSGWVELIGGSSPIYLLQKAADTRATESSADERRRYTRHWTPTHLDFVVPSLDLAMDLVLRAGAVLEGGVSEHSYGRLAMFSDPFGHGFCLLEFNDVGYDAPDL